MSVILQKLIATDVITTLGLLVLSVCFTLLWRRRRTYYLASKIPGVNGYPIIGNMLDFTDLREVIPREAKLHEQYGATVKVWIGPALAVVITKPEHLQIILTNCFKKCLRVYNGTMDFIGTGLILAEPDRWRIHRKLLNPAFNQRILDSYVIIFREQSNILVGKLKKMVGKPEFNVYDYFDKCTLDIVCETTMSTKVEAQTKPSVFFETMPRIFHLLIERIFRVWLHPDFVWNRSWRGIEMKKNVHITHEYTKMIVETSTQNRANRKASGEIELEEETKRRTFLDILLDAQENKVIDELEVLHEISTFINAGTDTASITCSYSLLCMAWYPDILKKVQAELDSIFGDSDRDANVEDLQKMEYLEMVIKEVLRMYPSVPYTARRIEKELDLGDGIILPVDCTAFIGHRGTHYNPDVWPEPEKFIPERFLPEEVAKRHPCSFIPFSAGPRNCIGFRYAYMAIKMMISSILRNYVPKTKLDPKKLIYIVDIILKLDTGFLLTLEERK